VGYVGKDAGEISVSFIAMNSLDLFLRERLAHRDQDESRRSLKISNSALVDFSSNDYLGLARAKELGALIATRHSEEVHGNGATGSRLLTGNSELVERLEQKLAYIFKAESALVFNSGYAANLAVLSCLPQKDDTIIYDELSHACIKDGARLSFARRFSFRHNDMQDLEGKIRRSHGKIFIVVESVYSMDGDEAPLEPLCSLAKMYGAYLIIDEAHSTGVRGTIGNGLCVEKGFSNEFAIRIYTFGKAMGVHGACVAGSNALRDFLINFARPFIYTTAMSPHSLVAIDSSFDYLLDHLHLQKQLRENIEGYKNGLSTLGRSGGTNAIQTILIPGNREVKAIALKLEENGFDVRPILSPTVPLGKERLRICLHAYNTAEQIQTLIANLKSLSLRT
jgi:8-amino-7-oxononanoate synthase